MRLIDVDVFVKNVAKSGFGVEFINRVTALLIDTPTIEPKQGEWTNAGVLTVQCSNCKSQFHELEAMNFCPNCGAKMKEY